VKEYYFYLDSTPTHSYMKYLYKYPQSEFPYAKLVEGSRRRDRNDPEYELLDTGVFNDNRYFDVFVEYAKADTEDILIKITVTNRGPVAANLRVLPTVWFRNTWSWGGRKRRPELHEVRPAPYPVIELNHALPGNRWLQCEGSPELLFTENETNYRRIFGVETGNPHVKDSINDYVVHGCEDAVNPQHAGTKAAAHYRLTVGAGETVVVRMRLADGPEHLPLQEIFAECGCRAGQAEYSKGKFSRKKTHELLGIGYSKRFPAASIFRPAFISRGLPHKVAKCAAPGCDFRCEGALL
jgi:hypothetical protein